MNTPKYCNSCSFPDTSELPFRSYSLPHMQCTVSSLVHQVGVTVHPFVINLLGPRLCITTCSFFLLHYCPVQLVNTHSILASHLMQIGTGFSRDLELVFVIMHYFWRHHLLSLVEFARHWIFKVEIDTRCMHKNTKALLLANAISASSFKLQILLSHEKLMELYPWRFKLEIVQVGYPMGILKRK